MQARTVTRRPPYLGTLTAAVAATGLLAARPALVRATPNPTVVLVLLFTAVLVAGLAASPGPAGFPRAGRSPGPAGPAGAGRSSGLAGSPGRAGAGWAVPLALGAGAFAAGRILGGGHGPAVLSTHLVVLNSFAAIAEEAFFRRLWYGLLLPAGPSLAVVGSAALFAAVHLATYGPAVLPLDLAAGLVLGWQRWATGGWAVPALTHIVANILVVI